MTRVVDNLAWSAQLVLAARRSPDALDVRGAIGLAERGPRRCQRQGWPAVHQSCDARRRLGRHGGGQDGGGTARRRWEDTPITLDAFASGRVIGIRRIEDFLDRLLALPFTRRVTGDALGIASGEALVDNFGGDDLTGSGLRLEPFGDVDDVADGREVP